MTRGAEDTLLRHMRRLTVKGGPYNGLFINRDDLVGFLDGVAKELEGSRPDLSPASAAMRVTVAQLRGLRV